MVIPKGQNQIKPNQIKHFNKKANISKNKIPPLEILLKKFKVDQVDSKKKYYWRIKLMQNLNNKRVKFKIRKKKIIKKVLRK